MRKSEQAQIIKNLQDQLNRAYRQLDGVSPFSQVSLPKGIYLSETQLQSFIQRLSKIEQEARDFHNAQARAMTVMLRALSLVPYEKKDEGTGEEFQRTVDGV